ncbi:OmpH family outer membrane protein [Acanthopleuribacter pedis]|uniref:OmpH family outer membrane protein n=1 Tax=Acanthopleuribacter pedis TaxID=442870 RepID=A0A8J7QS36_9BACT|nr:OmpH family outer membrane protein [Acanthopleuribacter pedis]MBO1323033.1 OmpH family outer membrane protein [Acanthopleuribacter pedis]
MKLLSGISMVLAVAALALVLLDRATPAAAPAVKIGFVRTGYAMDHLNLTKEARETFQKEQAMVNENLKQMEADLAAKHETFLKEQEALQRDARLNRIKELSKLEEELNQYRANASVELGKKERAIMGPVFEVVNSRIAAFARQEGYTMIWGTLSEGNILYGDPGHDITEAVVTALNEQP